MEDYKQEIISTRRGCLGSSDGKMLQQIAELGCVPKSAMKRMAVVKGLTESSDYTTAAMRAGDQMEMAIFSLVSMAKEGYESNPLWVSHRFSKNNVKLISHPDIVHADEKKKTLYVYEVKTTKYSPKETKETYKGQLWIHYNLAKEYASSHYGKGWGVRLMLAHYDTRELDLDDGITFDESRFSLHPIKFSRPVFDIDRAMTIVDEFLEDFDEYYEGDEIDAGYLPEKVQKEFDMIARTLMEIKEREDKVNEFKTRLYDFLLEKDIKSIKSDYFTISRVDPTVSMKMDLKTFFDEWSEKHPRLASKAVKDYSKPQKRKGYALIKLK